MPTTVSRPLRPARRPAVPEPAADAAPPPDEALYAASSRGDRAALEALVARWWEPAVRLARRVLQDPAAADDAAQEAMLSLARAAGRIALAGPFAPWFRTLVLNAARNAARGESRRARHEDTAERRSATRRRDRDLDPGALAERRLDRALIEEHIRRLPEESRFALAFHFYEGRSHAEVGAALGCPEKTATSRIRRGLERLRDSLGRAGYGAAVPEIAKLLRSTEAALVAGRAIGAAPSARALLERAAAGARRALLVKGGAALALVLCVLGAGRFLFQAPEAPRLLAGGPAPAAVAPAAPGARGGAGLVARQEAPARGEREGGAAPASPPREEAPPAAPREAAAAPPAAPRGAPSAATETAAATGLRVDVDLGGEPEAQLMILADDFMQGDQLIPTHAGWDYDLPPGVYQVRVIPGESSSADAAGVCEEVRLAKGERRHLRLTIPPPGQRSEVEITVRRAGGAPASNVKLKLYRDHGPAAPEVFEEGGRRYETSVTTDERGFARLGPRPAGEYEAEVEGAGVIGKLRVEAGRTVRAGLTIDARERTRLTLTDASGAPLPMLIVEFPGLAHGSTRREFVTGNDGVLRGVSEDGRSLEERLDLPLGALALLARTADGVTASASFESRGGEVSVVVPGIGLLRVEGRLARAEDAPDGTTVTATVFLEGGGTRVGGGEVRGGAFSFALAGGAGSAREILLAVGRCVPVLRPLGAGEASVRFDALRLERGHALSGRVAAEAPFSWGYAWFTLEGTRLTVQARLDAEGRFRLEGLPSGRGRIEARGGILLGGRSVDVEGAPVDVDPARVEARGEEVALEARRAGGR